MMNKCFAVIAASCSMFAFGEGYGILDITSEVTSCKDISRFGNIAEAKALTLIDSANIGSVTVKIGKSAKVNEITWNYNTRISSNYDVYGTTIYNLFYKIKEFDEATSEWKEVKKIPLRSYSASPTYGVAAGGYYEIEKKYIEDGGYLYPTVKLTEIRYDEGMNRTVVGTIEFWWDDEDKMSLSNMVGTPTGTFAGMTGSDLQIDYSLGCDTYHGYKETLPDDYMYKITTSTKVITEKTVTREMTVSQSVYSNGIIEVAFPVGTFLMPDYYIRCVNTGIPEHTCDIKLIYAK